MLVETMPAAELKHGLQRRTRIRIRSKRGDAAYFSQVAQELRKLPAVHTVQTNNQTGSILITHSDEALDSIAALAQASSLFTLAKPADERKSLLQEAAAGLSAWDSSLSRISHGSLDFRSVLYVALVVMALVQIWRGQVLMPASVMLWYALDLLGYIRSGRDK